MDKKLVLIDGHSILNRAFYGIPDLTNSEGLHTNAVYGFLNILFKILEEEKPEYLTVAFDVSQPTFRHERFAEYKGTRKSMPDDLREQVPVMKEVLKAMGIKIVERGGYEADDLLGTIAKRGEAEGLIVSVVSGDRDLLQLATDKIKIRIPKTKKTGTEIEDYNAKDVEEKYGVTPIQFIDLKGLMGDASDNIPGVPGIGEKTASKIIGSFKTIENAYEHIEEVMPNKARESLKANYDLAILSKELATIKIDCELDYKLEDGKIGHMFNDEAFVMLKKLEFKNFLTRFQKEVEFSNDDIEGHFKLVDSLEIAEQVFSKVFAEAKKKRETKKTSTGQVQKDGSLNDIFKGKIYDIPDTPVPINKMLLAIESAKEFYVSSILIQEAGEVLGLALSFGDKDTYFIKLAGLITEQYIVDKMNEIITNDIVVSVIDLKEMLPLVKADEQSLIFDLSVAAYLLNPIKDSYFYDDLARDYLGMTVKNRTELIEKSTLRQAEEEKETEFLNFCCYQAFVAYQALPKLVAQLKEEDMLLLYLSMEMPLIYTLYDMEYRGVKVNKEELKAYGDKLYVRIIQLEKDIYEQVGEEFNINSPKQLGVILFEQLKLPFAKKTKTGYSTSADILEKLKCEHPVISMILEYRQLTKLKSTYADGLANYINEKDQRIHGKFNQTITATGRLSSTEPNLQNIPIKMELGREIRKVFIPEQDYVFLDADYSQIELRVLAHMSGDEMLIEAYKQAQDIHQITASQVFHTPLEEVTSLQRSNAKAVNFGIVYGISSFGLGQDLNITGKEAEGYIKKYFETYPRVKSFLDELVSVGKNDGAVTSLFGRKRPVPELSSSNFRMRSFGERIAMNSPVQGTAADIIKIAMIRVNMKLKANQLKSRLILQIHDELLIETHKDEVEQVKQILAENMHDSANLSVPLEVEVNTGMNWYESK